MKTGVLRAALLLALAAVSGAASAHRPWLLPSTTLADEEPYVTVDAAVSEHLFDFDHMPLKLDGLAIVGPDGKARAPENVLTGKLRTSFDLNVAEPGTYRISLVNDSAIVSYKLGGEMKRWRGPVAEAAKQVPAGAQEVKTMHFQSRIETFVSAQKAGGQPFPLQGTGLELEPLSNPTDLHSGDAVRWRFLIDGKPAANLPVSLVPGGVRFRGTLGELRYRTDAQGELKIALPAPGMYLLSASVGDPQSAQARRASYAATLEIQPQ
ncbi:MAG TPA: DUF4198 domain-containing protein [Telluria sp.]|nr:DUF4198 domain-containing protein [Telluria sp.]